MNTKGFTLIELTIIFSVIAILSVIGLSISIDYNRSQVLNAAYEELKTTLNTAKSRALSQNKPCTGTVIGHQVYIAGTTQYRLQAVCSVDTISKSFNLPRDLSFTSPIPATVSFPVLTGGSSGGTITITGYNKSKTVTVDTAGNIQ
ncbi:MAG: GspH/FimT family pseudopilin [Candidatus Levybacteria bacterium]|nr:GspH/FimT family pseudopilin [Candidatus Levybacteria bacterium]